MEKEKTLLERVTEFLSTPEGLEDARAFFQNIQNKRDLQEKKHLEVYMPMDDILFKNHVITESDKQNALGYVDMEPEIRDLCEIMLEYGKPMRYSKTWSPFESKRVKYKMFTVSVYVGQGSFYRIMLGKRHIFTSD